MTEPETIYSTTYRPDQTDATQVLAFLLVDPKLFADDGKPSAELVEMLTSSKASMLAMWFEHDQRARRS